MTRPNDVSDFGEAVYAQLAPVADLDSVNNWDLLIYIAALAEMFRMADDLAHSDPAWSRMVDPDNCPVEGLPWLGQLIGVTVNTNLSEADQRLQIKNHLGWNRGTAQAVKDSIAPYLTGTKSVRIKERDTSPYHFGVLTNIDETPPNKTYEDIYLGYASYQAFFLAFGTYEAYWITDGRNQIQATIAANKPAGLQYSYATAHDIWMSKIASLIVSGNEITDAKRTAALSWATSQSGGGVDQYQSDSSFFVGRSATNLFRRGQCDSTTDYSPDNATTVAIDATVPAPFSTQSIKVTTDGVTNFQGIIAGSATGLAIAAGTSEVGSIWFKGVAGLSYIVRMRIANTDASTTLGTNTTITASGAWQLITPTALAVAAAKTGDRIFVNIFIPTAARPIESFWVSHPMLESGQTVVAPYVPTTGGSTATRGAGRIQIPGSLINTNKGWFAGRIRYGFSSTNKPATGSGGEWLLRIMDAGTNGIDILFREASNEWRTRANAVGVGVGDAISAVQTFNVADGALVIGTWDIVGGFVRVKISVNGAAFISTTTILVSFGAPTQFDIGSAGGSTTAIQSRLKWAAMGVGVLTDTDAATLNALGDSEPLYATLPSAAEVTAIIPFDDTTYYVPS